ncbi:hypothetical protein HNR46_003185 [Haloferula luteola]|uniref:LamG-like jellyroll fold domain-containing protein n=1 Tax=Haloferula luteola TaxID=595692 RepID=A0A840V7C2_9BACT|nr:LamG domain-containing protein [Haloferula luteola]MBB5352936.1 hypothetical protein [Haloferula luteola]
MPSQAGQMGPLTITVPSSAVQGVATYTVTGWFKLGKDSIKSAPNNIYRAVYMIYDKQGTGPSPNNAPLAQGTGLLVRKNPVGGGEQWFVGGYKQTYYWNEYPYSNGNPKAVMNGHSFNLPAGTNDDGKWHHFAVTRSTAANGQKVYLDGNLVVQGALLEYTVAHDSDTTFTFGALYPGHGPTSWTEAYIDRVRIQSRLLTANEILGYYRQDIDQDGLWDVTEASTALWRDANSDGVASLNEYSYISSPFQWQPADTDTDGDGATDLAEQAAGTDIGLADTDGDLIPDGYELEHGLNPLDPSDGNLDPDLDGLTNLEEWIYNTDPNNPNTDGGTGDNTNDGDEVGQGSDPNDPSDGGQAPEPGEQFTIRLGVGDESGSESEDYVLNCFKLDPATGEEKRIYTLRSGGFGEYSEKDVDIFRKGETYSFQIKWQGTNNDTRSASPGVSAEGPDFDYTLKIEPANDSLGTLIDSWNPETGETDTGDPIIADDASNVAADVPEWRTKFESKRVIFASGDIDIDSDNNDGLALPRRDTAEEDKEDYVAAEASAAENPGKFVKISTGDADNDGIPDFADGMDVHGGLANSACYPFVPVVVDLPALKRIKNAKVKFEYDEADPAGIVRTVVANQIPKWSPGNGSLRLWTKNGNKARRSSDVAGHGDLVKSNVEYAYDDLKGAGTNGSFIFYVEAVKKSAAAADKSITLHFSADGTSWEKLGVVRLTAIPRVILADVGQSLTPLAGSQIKPAFEDGTNATGASLGGTVSGSTLVVGEYGPHPYAGSDDTKDRERLTITYQTGVGSFTDPEDSTVLLVARPDLGSSGPVFPLMSQEGEGLGGGGYTTLSEGGYPPEANGSEEWEDTFERILFEKYEEAEPRIEDLERDAFELWGWTYGGRSWEWFSSRNVWRDGTHIYVEDSLTPEQAADAYYAFLKKNLPTEAQGANITPILRYWGEVYTELGEDRAKIGQHMAKHWDLVETTAGMLESEYMFVGADFAISGVLQIRRVRNLTFFTEGKTFAVPLVRRNWARGNITEHDTLVNSLGYSRNAGPGAVKYIETIDGQAIGCIPDAIRPRWFLEVKDVKSLSFTRQIRAEFAASVNQSKRVCIIITGRTKKLSTPLLDHIKSANGMLVRRNVNTDAYEFWDHWDTGTWQAIDKSDLLQYLANP